MIRTICIVLLWLSVQVMGYSISYLKHSPVIDGEISESEWAGVAVFKKKPEAYMLTIYIGWFGDKFCLACDCRDAKPNQIRSVVAERDGLGIWSDDCIEIFIDTNCDKASYYHFIVNAKGALYDEFVKDRNWNVKGMKYAVKRSTRGWSCEIAIPVSSFDRSDVYGRWAINVMRHFRRGYQVLGGRAHAPKSWQVFYLPDSVTEKILKPTIDRKLNAEKKVFDALKLKAKHNIFYADIYPYIVSVELKFKRIKSQIGSAHSQRIIDEIDDLKKDIDQLNLKINRATGFGQIANQCGGKAPQMLAFTLSPMVKVRKDFLLPAKLKREIKMSAAKGESESGQIVLASWNKPVRTIRVKVSDIINSQDGHTKIRRENIHIYKVCYVYAYQTCRPEFPIGWYPDPLVRFEAFDMPAYDCQPIWLTVDVPRNAKAGIYKGKLTISSVQAGDIEIPIELKVRNFSLPITPALKTSFSVWPKLIAYQIGIDRKSPKVAKLVYNDYWQQALKHRITLRNVPTYGPKFNKFVADILRKGATTIALKMWPLLAAKPANKKAIQEQLIRNGWIDKAFVYIWDEPSKKDYPKIIKRAKRIKPYAPKIKLLCTTRYDKGLDPYIDIWVPRFSWFNKNPKPYRDAVKRGDELWLYTCAHPQRPYPNLFLELPAIEPRICVLMCWRYGASGFLYYSTNYWKSKDIWLNVRGYPEANLDGVLFYPARDGRPVLSIRLEILRDGIDDFDYLAILQKLTNKLKASSVGQGQHKLISQAQAMLDITPIIKSFTEWTQDVHKLEDYRNKVANLIEQIKSQAEQ